MPQRWFNITKKEVKLVQKLSVASLDRMSHSQILVLHQCSGNPGVWHNTYFVRRVCPTVSKKGQTDMMFGLKGLNQCLQ